MSDSSLIFSAIVWGATFVIIGARLLNMIAYNPWGLEQPWLRLFETERWVLFRILIIVSGFTMSFYAFQTGALGHAWGNGCVALVTLLPQSIRNHRCCVRFFDAIRAIVLSRRGAQIVFVLIPLILFCFTLRTGFGLKDFGNAFQTAGGWLLVTGFSSMTLNAWGTRSANSLSYIRLALSWDFLLLVGACLLWNPPLIVLEVGALVVEIWNLRTRAASICPSSS